MTVNIHLPVNLVRHHACITLQGKGSEDDFHERLLVPLGTVSLLTSALFGSTTMSLYAVFHRLTRSAKTCEVERGIEPRTSSLPMDNRAIR